jgi:hypothetical protein
MERAQAEPANCRSSHRNRNDPSNRNNNLGFRLALNSIGLGTLPGWVGPERSPIEQITSLHNGTLP